MKKNLSIFLFALYLSACASPAPAAPTSTRSPALTETITPTSTIEIPTFTATPQPDFKNHPVFLAWPLPASIGLARISQYPNTKWTWNYLGLNEGYQCPPMFGYLELSYEYWRDTSIPIEQDQAQTDPHNFQMIECYTTGGAEGMRGHEGTDIKAPADTPVYAVADGKVAGWGVNGLNSMIILKHCLGGAWDDQNQCAGTKWYTTYMHIIINNDLQTKDIDILQGSQVGTINNQYDNSHLHFEVGLDQRSYKNYVNPWGRDASPWLGCMWLDQSLCPLPDPNINRIALNTNSSLSIKQGETTIVIHDTQDVKKIRLWKDRATLLDSHGNLFLRDGRFNADVDSMRDWILLAEHVFDFEITDQRIAMLDADRNLFVNESDQRSEWIPQAQQIRSFSISNQRIGYITMTGDLFVKEGELQNKWTMIANSVSAFQLNDNRIAISDSQGNLSVNEGAVNSEWKPMAQHVRAFQLTNLRVGIIDADNNLLLKEGNLRAEWVLMAENVKSFQLSNYRALAVFEDGTFKYKEGNAYQAWRDLPAGLEDAFLNDASPVYVQ